MRLKEHTVSVRLSDVDLKHYLRILARFGSGSTNSERFRSMLVKMDLPYASRLDNSDWSFEE